MYYLLYSIIRILSHIPFRVMYFISDCLFYLVYYVFRYRRRIVRKNLTESFTSKSEKEIIKIEKQFYHFFVDMILESVKLASASKDEIKRRMSFKNIEEVNETLKQGKSISLYLGHYANWEWCSSIPLHLESDVTSAQIYHKLSNQNMDRLMLYIRERMGAVCVDMRKTARYATELVANRKVCIIGFIADQSPKRVESHHFLHFLNHNTPVLTGTEKITKHYGFEAFFLNVKRVKRGYYEAEFIKLHDNPQSLPDYELTSLYYRMLEKCINTHPELYLWSHNRFRNAEILNK
ncbi:lysophospholipid acyltransferase family protein [Bacteroides caecigallinarum]|uniref:lysophospholipid acyltransferase family protein n=1 Tax=Bacteroides caecigallinarum TaxID=1411144 RepID=UPI0021D47C06|nr:lysophospholipid acyltransferase family protein [Bacteroides caecigallinarum]